MTELERMKELAETLNQASRAYYQEDREIMSNLQYDHLYEELEKLERRTGITLANSPTVSVGYEALEELPKETHETSFQRKPMKPLCCLWIRQKMWKHCAALSENIRFCYLGSWTA